jgi:hypothetical protein
VFEKVRIELPGDKRGVSQNALVQRYRGLNSLNYKAIQGAVHARDCFGTVAPVRDQLCD